MIHTPEQSNAFLRLINELSAVKLTVMIPAIAHGMRATGFAFSFRT